MLPESHIADAHRLLRERNLFLRLLELGHREAVQPLLQEALALAVEATGAAQGYVELRQDGDAGEPRFSMAHACSDAEVQDIRRSISRGIVAAAIEGGKVIQTPSALFDQRFAAQSSVLNNRIGAVLCAPIGTEDTLGVLYLHSHEAAGPFTDEDVALVEVFARHVTPFVTRLVRANQKAKEQDPTQPLRARLRVTGLIGRSSAMATAFRYIEMVADSDVTLLLTGSSGTGKTALARAIHQNSSRRDDPFVELNCATVPDALAESELFGAMKGSHSGAHQQMHGKIAAAATGTLFLDEVGELSSSVQAKLLTFLESKQYYPLGAQSPQHADVRIITATNSDLEREVSERRFREDLYYRISVIPFRVSDLCDRAEDIAGIAEYFSTKFAVRGEPPLAISSAGLRALAIAQWPGNIRQLANVVRAGTIRARSDDATMVMRKHLFPSDESRDDEQLGLYEATRVFQRKLLADTLSQNKWNVSQSARDLGIARSTLNSLIRQHRLKRQ